MSPAAIKDEVLAALTEVAPELDITTLDPDQPLREQVDIDSYDFLRFVVVLAEKLGIEIPERDYDRIPTLNRLVEYLRQRSPEGSA